MFKQNQEKSKVKAEIGEFKKVIRDVKTELGEVKIEIGDSKTEIIKGVESLGKIIKTSSAKLDKAFIELIPVKINDVLALFN